MPRISNNYPTSGLPQGQATKAKPTPTSKPKPKTSTSKNENKLGPAGLVSTSSAAAASRYAGLDPTRGRGMGGVEYTPKVLDQMRVNARTGLPDNHGFPRIADNSARLGDSFAIRNGDGKIRGGIELKGHYNGKPGKFQWIVEPGGKQSNHRLFVPKGRPSPIPANAIIRGTGAARVAGRVMLPVGLALDGYEVATAKNKPKKLTEKVGAWGGAR